MSMSQHERWTPQANQWNGIDPHQNPFEELVDRSKTAPISSEASLVLGSIERVLSWHDERFPVKSMETPATGADYLD